uniref:hypothetical protein n=1 Tax=Thaumasiovibrio occultus TaxID=1891184 RepID=UPI000B3527C8|nr:hypothetical protein [Thaumasiovibrio occultus]
MRLFAILVTLFLVGCANAPSQRAKLELFYSVEQTTLTAKQQVDLAALFDNAAILVMDVAPATHQQPFEALMVSQARMKAIRQLATEHSVTLTEHYQPQQTPDTIVLKAF